MDSSLKALIFQIMFNEFVHHLRLHFYRQGTFIKLCFNKTQILNTVCEEF